MASIGQHHRVPWMFPECLAWARARLEIDSAWVSDSAARWRSRSDGVDAVGGCTLEESLAWCAWLTGSVAREGRVRLKVWAVFPYFLVFVSFRFPVPGGWMCFDDGLLPRQSCVLEDDLL